MILSKYAICGCKRFSGILSNLGLKKPLNKIPLLGDIFFFKCSSTKCNYKYE